MGYGFGQNDSVTLPDTVVKKTPLKFTPPAEIFQWPEYKAFQSPVQMDSLVPGSLSLRVRSTSFFKNNEFKNPFIYGQSLVGLFFEPVFEFHPDGKTTIRAGAHLLKYYGRDAFDRILPVISVRYDATEHFSMVFGTIYGTVNHGLIEPLQDFEDYLVNNYENGIQFLFKYPDFKSDVWLNWEQFIKLGDPFPEIFTAATNNEFRFFSLKNLTVSAPFSAVFRHTGGEIDSYWVPGGTKLNVVHGLRAELNFPKGFIRNMYGVQNFLEFIEVNPGSHITIPWGHGSYTRAGISTKIGSLEAGYWTSSDFTSAHGMPMFLSTSIKDPNYYQASREMLTLKYQFTKELTRYLNFVFRFEPYYHFDTGRMDHSWSVYLKLDEEFFLAKTKNRGKGG
jgi:hypothetical protein